MDDDQPQNQKSSVQQQTVEAINKYDRPAKTGLLSLPYQLPGLIALLPAYITDRLVHRNVTHNEGLLIVLLVFFSFQIVIGLYFRSLLRKHPDLKWQILIR